MTSPLVPAGDGVQAPTTPAAPMTSILPLPADGPNSLGSWRDRLKKAEDLVQPITDAGKKNIDAYRGKLPAGTVLKADKVVVNTDFANVEQKKPQLFGQVPTVQLTAELPGLDSAVGVFQAVVNKYLSPRGVNAGAMMKEVLFDVLCPSGYAWCKIGYDAYQDGLKSVPSGEMQPDPSWQAPPPMPPSPGSMLGLQPPPQAPMVPVMQDVPNIVYEKYSMERGSPAKLRVPAEWYGSNFDKSPWLAQRFSEDEAVAKAKYHLADDIASGRGGEGEKSSLADTVTAAKRSGQQVIDGTEIFYYASIFDPTVKDPRKMRQLVLIDEHDEPVIHRDSPYQDVNDKGELIGMIGNPIHVLTLRYVSDTAFPPSDCTISRAQVDERSKGRTQMIQQRNRALPLRWGNLEALGGQATIDKIESGEIQSIIPVQGDGNQMMGQIATATFPRENFSFDEVIKQDVDMMWGFSDNQRGQATSQRKTATELDLMQQNANVRMDAERAEVLKFFVGAAEKLASLIQLFATDADYVALEGPQGDQQLQQWDKTTIAGRFAFTARPDSTIRVDAAQAKADALKTYQLLANDPFVNRQELLLQLLRKIDLDPQKIVVQPPQKPPEVPKVNFSCVGADMDPSVAQFPIVMELLRAGGVEISPAAIQEAQAHAVALASVGAGQIAANDPGKTPPTGAPDTTHPGSASEVAPLNKHVADLTRQRSGPQTGVAA